MSVSLVSGIARKLCVVVALVTAGCATTSDSSQLRGYYTWGHEVRVFQPCGSSQAFWVTGDAALLTPLQEQSDALAKAHGKPYQPVYVEAVAVMQGKATEGFAAAYDGVYRLVSVQKVSSQRPADCQVHER